MIAWDKICQPKKLGGLWLKKTEAVNLAFQCKLAWKLLHDKENLWVEIMTAKYLKRSSFLETTQKVGDSPVWKSLLRCRSLLRKGLRWRIGTEDHISFWWDNWLDNANLAEILDMGNSLPTDPDCTVSAFITQDKTRDIEKLRVVLNNDLIFNKIVGIPIPIFG